MKVKHVVAALFAIGLVIIAASFFFSNEHMSSFFTYLSWVVFLLFSFMLTLGFSDQKVFVRVLIFIASITLLGGGYIMLERVLNANMLIINFLILLFFLLFVLLMFSQPLPLPIKNKAMPKSPYQFIATGRISTKRQLRQFFEEQQNENVSFEIFVRAALSEARERMDDEQWIKARDLLEPILSEIEEQQPFNRIKGREKETIQQIYTLTNQSDFKHKNSIIFQLKSLVDTIYEREQKYLVEEKRNSQALTLSIAGLIITIILSSISICISLFNWNL